MKKSLVMLLAFVLLLSLCACSNSDDQSGTPGSTGQSTNSSIPASTSVSTPGSTPTSTPEDKPTSTPTLMPDDMPTSEPTSNLPTCSHNWIDATCNTPKTCSKCGATEGSVTEHNWAEVTCTAPKTCSKCNVTEGSASGHSWSGATCTVPKTCSKCNETEGEAIGHIWKDATYTEPKTCTSCGATVGTTIPMPEWTFTDGGDHIVATNGAQSGQIPIDISHLPQNYEDDTVIQTVNVRRSDFKYVNGWIFYNESYSISRRSKITNMASSSVYYVGYSMIKMDGTGQIRIQNTEEIVNYADAIAGYADGYLYYIKLEGLRVCGEEEHQRLYKCTFSQDGGFGTKILVAELDGLTDNEALSLDAWIDGEWVFYLAHYDFDEDGKETVYKVKLDGTESYKVS